MKYILFLSSLFLFACDHPEQPGKTIKVSGEGKIRVKPDLVILTLNVSFTQPRMVDAVRLTQGTVDTVVNILQQYGHLDNDIKTSSNLGQQGIQL